MRQYDGTVVVVSHNRYFLDSFINKVLVVKDGGAVIHEGTVEEYLERLAAEEQFESRQQEVRETGVSATEEGNGLSRKEQRRIEAEKRRERSRKVGQWSKKLTEAEEQVEKLESLKERLEEKMADPGLYQDEEAWASTSREYDDCKRRLERWYERWEEAQAKIDEIDAALAAD